ncbi:MAG: peptide chain release factor N(5)-glutamine methyltransferase [Burkholderiaceae bacterium]|nr:peptide chain release factor N(5)-glutamine methyltransferase [Burkholderiaceae bacterium]
MPDSVRKWLRKSDLDPVDARLLLSHVTGLSRIELITRSDRLLTETEFSQLEKLAKTRKQGMPIPYILNNQEFFSRNFKVNPSVLIPRPDTEVLIEWLLDNLRPSDSVVDLGTGSGCIAITLKKELPTLQVSASDISIDALNTAKENASDLEADITFRQGSWLDAFDSNITFDVLVSNPPYIRKDDHHLQALRFEPINALTDGDNGLQCIDTILSQAKERLSHSLRIIAIEHGWDQGEYVRNLFAQHGFFNAQTHRDYGNNERFTTWQHQS